MKPKLLATTALLATLIGLSTAARAANPTPTFTPIDQLPPEQRQAIMAELEQMHMNVDWSEVVVGVNEKGEITFKSRATICTDMAQPSCNGTGIGN